MAPVGIGFDIVRGERGTFPPQRRRTAGGAIVRRDARRKGTGGARGRSA